MKGSYIVIILILIIIFAGFFTWLWMQGFSGNLESIAAVCIPLQSFQNGSFHL